MLKPLTNSQSAKLGDRLRDGVYSAEDLTLLSEYRTSFAPALAKVVSIIRMVIGIEPTERPEKSNKSIIYKLQRLASTRLDRMQDIAGCRFVVATTLAQDSYVTQLTAQFPDHKIHDLREEPHSGYRAVHVVIRVGGHRVEVQIRTQLQDLWAQCSERWAFTIDPTLKYGGGPPQIQQQLQKLSRVVHEHERSVALTLAKTENVTMSAAVQMGLKVDLHQQDEKVRSMLLRFKDIANVFGPFSGY